MTAEIAIINRSAVTLATDSAVTLTVRGAEKIYNSADKLFELSDRDPIGVMVYNNLEYMGISLEVAIKRFRQKNVRFRSVAEAAASFFKYLLEDLAPDEEIQKRHAQRILYSTYLELRSTFERKITRELEETSESCKVEMPDIFTDTIERCRSRLENLRPADGFTDEDEAQIEQFYMGPLDELVDEIFGDLPLDAAHKTLLRKVGVLSLHREVVSDLFSGVVVAGFGEEEIFPSLVSFKTDGVVLGRIKTLETERVSTDRETIGGDILPFAQREMVDRFLNGVDPQFERAMENYLAFVLERTGEAIVEALLTHQSQAERQKVIRAISDARTTAVTAWREKLLPVCKGRFSEEVRDMISLMPKQELATLAQELINLTSVNRRFSVGTESVGGPIDVAVISRVDGFVWVRRKHYFDRMLNPRYFHRKFGVSHD